MNLCSPHLKQLISFILLFLNQQIAITVSQYSTEIHFCSRIKYSVPFSSNTHLYHHGFISNCFRIIQVFPFNTNMYPYHIWISVSLIFHLSKIRIKRKNRIKCYDKMLLPTIFTNTTTTIKSNMLSA